MATGTGSGTYDQVCEIQKRLEISPSATAASSPVYGSKGGGKSSKMEKMDKKKK